VSRVTGILRAAECNKAPFMYEMKGALCDHGPGSAGFPASRLRVSQSPGLTVPVWLVSQPHRSRSTGRPASLFRFTQLSRLPVRSAQLPGLAIRFARLPGLPSATRRPPVPDTRCKFRFPGLSIAPGKPPGWCPFPAVKVFLRPSRASRKRLPEFILSFFRIHTLSTGSRRLSACHSGYPPPYAQLLHRSPDVTQKYQRMIAQRNHSVFSRRPSVNPEFPTPARSRCPPPTPRGRRVDAVPPPGR
jgi:hypothetical protein